VGATRRKTQRPREGEKVRGRRRGNATVATTTPTKTTTPAAFKPVKLV